ncbi:hypothetical protein HPB51_002763 [Rhipicephalus microplus]|uniref:Uncharacterized protein n=1 Tax=Rhipicephalus microplus TaxID=6941 RepID=A0A9J6DLG6_RHIMP|nr:hypothetical protein HPB51_002763 [Rhipicephalus microplus]
MHRTETTTSFRSTQPKSKTTFRFRTLPAGYRARKFTTDAKQGAERRQPLPPVDRHTTPETYAYMTGRCLLSTGSASAEADDAPSLQELEVVPHATLKRHVIPFFKQRPPHVKNFGGSRAQTTKEGEGLKPKMSAGTMGKQNDKDEAEPDSEEKPKDKDNGEAQAKEKQMGSQPGSAKTYKANRLKVNPTAQ